MPRPKKEKPNRADGLYEIKATVGKDMYGHAIRKSFYSSISKEDARKQAEQWKIDKQLSLQADNIFIEKDVTFGQWALKWLDVYKKNKIDENTYRLTYENTVVKHLIPFFGKADLKSIKPVDIAKFYSEKAYLSTSVLSKIQMCLNGIFETAIENDLCYKNPAKSVTYTSNRVKNQKRVYSDEEIEKVEQFAEGRMPEVILLLETGLRRGELLGLQWEDIDFENKTITVRRAVADSKSGVKVNKPKWDSYRTNPLSNKAINTLYSLIPGTGYIFPTNDGLPKSPNTWSQKLKRFMDNLNSYDESLAKLTAHELRHTYGTMLRRRGVDIYTIQKIMGHRDIKMTSEIYVHNEIDTLREAMKNSL